MNPHSAIRAVHVASCRLPTAWAEFDLHGYLEPESGREHVALTLGAIAGAEPVLARVHSECLTGDVLFSRRCDCGAQLEAALREIARAGRGVLVYLRQEGRGIGLLNKIKAYRLQETGVDTVEANRLLGFKADLREYDIAAAILRDLGVESVDLLTNNPRKIDGLERHGIVVAKRVPLVVGWNDRNARYRFTKAIKLGHLLAPDALGPASASGEIGASAKVLG